MASPSSGRNSPDGDPPDASKIVPVQAVTRQPAGTPYSRIAAALDYARLSNEAAAEALGISITTVSRLRTGKNAAENPESYYRGIARVTGVPLWFLEHGFEGYRVADESEAEPSVGERLDALQGEVEALRNQHRELRETRERLDAVESDLSAVLDLAAKWPIAEPPGVRAPATPASPRADSTRRRSERRQAEGPPREDER